MCLGTLPCKSDNFGEIGESSGQGDSLHLWDVAGRLTTNNSNVVFRSSSINSTISRIVQRLGYSAFTSSDLKHRKDPGSIPGTGKAFPFCVRNVFVDAVVVGCLRFARAACGAPVLKMWSSYLQFLFAVRSCDTHIQWSQLFLFDFSFWRGL